MDDFVRRCITGGDMMRFYQCRAWKRLRREVLMHDKYECQICKGKGRYAKAAHVHHVKHVRDHPELAMSRVYTDKEGTHRQLVSVCFSCHRAEHTDESAKKPKPVTAERWD